MLELVNKRGMTCPHTWQNTSEYSQWENFPGNIDYQTMYFIYHDPSSNNDPWGFPGYPVSDMTSFEGAVVPFTMCWWYGWLLKNYDSRITLVSLWHKITSSDNNFIMLLSNNYICVFSRIKLRSLRCIALHFNELYCIALQLHCFALHFNTLHHIASHCITLYCIALYYIELYCITLHCIALHCIVLHCIELHCIALLVYCRRLFGIYV